MLPPAYPACGAGEADRTPEGPDLSETVFFEKNEQ